MENRLFNITNCYITCGIESLINEGSIKEKELHEILLKHMCNIDDNKYKEDLEANLEAIKTGNGRVLSVYELNGERLYINSYMQHLEGKPIAIETTLMLCNEY